MKAIPGKLKKASRFIKRIPSTIISILLGALMLVAASPLCAILLGVV